MELQGVVSGPLDHESCFIFCSSCFFLSVVSLLLRMRLTVLHQKQILALEVCQRLLFQLLKLLTDSILAVLTICVADAAIHNHILF